MIGDPEDILLPELVRVFFSLSKKGCEKHRSREQEHQLSHHGFDYKAATEVLKKDPQQVHYVTFECQKRRERRGRKRDNNNIAKDFGNRNFFLHSPLRWACIETTQEAEAMEFLRTIRTIDPTQFLLQDSHGDLPIEGECVLNATLELLSFLLDIYLDYDFVCPNGDDMTKGNFNPITCLCGSYWWNDIRKAYEEVSSGTRIVSGTNVLEDNLGIEDNFWKKIILLTKAFYHKTIEEDNNNPNEEHKNENNSDHHPTSSSMLRITNEYGDRRVRFRLLHACAGIDWFPPNLLRLLVAAFPNALLEEDEDGNLPIHIASGGYFESYKTFDTEGEDFEANSGYQKTTLDIFLEANPSLARLLGADGKHPLELAIGSECERCGVFGDGRSALFHQRWRPWHTGGIDSLLRAYPDAARVRSPVTGKLPLEMALDRGSYQDWEDGIQALLKVYPEAAGRKNPMSGKYPLQLAIELETHFDDGIYGLLEASPEAAAWSDVWVSSRERIPLFAHAASETCSLSVVYKLLRTNPEACRRSFVIESNDYKKAKTNSYPTKKRIRNGDTTKEKTGRSALSLLSFHNHTGIDIPSTPMSSHHNKRFKSIGNNSLAAILPQL